VDTAQADLDCLDAQLGSGVERVGARHRGQAVGE
jgi:hypothetical protein